MKKILIALFLTTIFLIFTFYALKIIEKPIISGIILPHHDLVGDKRAEVLKEINELINPQTIILISTNHFNAGNANIIITDKVWNILDAQINPNKEIIDKILDSKLTIKDEMAFSHEHGIFNLLAPIHNYFPNAKIVPIIIKPGANREDLKSLTERLFMLCNNNCLLIASVDFSHYLPGALAEIHDKLSIRALDNLDENLIWQTEVDSREALYTTILWAKMHQTNKFVLKENTNSGKINNSRDTETTSYVFSWYGKGSFEKIKPETTFIVYKGINEKENNIGERFFRGTDQIDGNGNLLSLIETINLSQTEKDKIKYLNELVNNKNLAVAGSISANNIQIVLLPWKDTNGKAQLLRGDEKTNYIRKIRDDLNLFDLNINYGYDIIKIDK